MDLSTLKIVVDTKDIARATIELNKFAGDVTQAEARMAKARKTATDVHTQTANRWISENKDIIATNRMVATAAREESLAVAGMDMAARRAAESKGILAKYSHQLKRTLLDLTPIISGVGLLTLAHGAIQATDKYTKLTSQLKIATNSAIEYGQALSEVKRISSAAQADITAITSLYQRLSLATEASGVSQSEIAMITETVALGLKANGASARESASAMLQLSQSFGSGRMAGEEFNSMAEAAPNVLRALAKSMGVPYGQLKQLASETKITTAVMVKAFTDPALLETFRAQAASMRTITGSWVELTNALVLYVGEGSKTSGATKILSGTLSFLADNLKLIGDAVIFVASAMAIQLAGSILKAAANLVVLEGAAGKAMAKLTALSATTKAGIIGAFLFGAYLAADYLGWIDDIFNRAEKNMKNLMALAGDNPVFAKAFGFMDEEMKKYDAKIAQMEAMKNLGVKVSQDATALQIIAAIDKTIESTQRGMMLNSERDRAIEQLKALRKGFEATNQAAQQQHETSKTLAHDELVMQQRMIDLSKQYTDKKLTDAEYLKKVNEELYGSKEKVTKADNSAAEAAAKEVAASQAKIAVMESEINTGVKLTDGQKELIKLAYEQGQSAIALTDKKYKENVAMTQGVVAQELRVNAIEEEKKAQEELSKIDKSIHDNRQKMLSVSNDEIAKLQEKIIQERLEIASIGKTKDQIILLEAARYDNVTSIMEETLALNKSFGNDSEEIRLLEEKIKLRKELKGVMTDKADAEAKDAAFKKETKMWEDMFKKVDDFAHDAFLSIFDKGKNAFEQIGQVIKKSILEMLYQMTIHKWIFQVGVAGGGTMAAGAAAAMPGMGSGGGGMLSGLMGSGISSITSGVSAAMEMGVVNGFSAGLTSMFSGGASAYSAGLMLPMVGIGLAAGALLYKGLSMGAKVSGTTTLAGQFSGEGFAGQYQTPWTQKGGWFRSNRSGMDTQGLGGDQAGLSGMVGGTAAIFTALADASGVATRSLEGWTFAINRQVSTQEQQKQLAIDLANSMGNHVLPMLESFRKAGESLADTALRLTIEVVTLNQFYSQLGVTTKATIQSADQLATALGGIANASQLMNSFIRSFAPNAQVIENSLNTLAAAGISQAEFFTTADQWWAFMQSASLEQQTAMLANQGAIQDYIGAMDKSKTAIGENIKALKDQSIAAYEAARSMIDGLRQFADSVRDLQRSLWLGAQSPVADKAAFTRAEFVSVNTAAATGDVTAQGRLSGAATSYLDAAKLQAASAVDYARDFAFVQESLSATAFTTDNMATTAELQLAELVQANVWLSALDEKNRLQNNSLQYLLTASVEASTAAREAIVTQAISDAMDSIARAVIGAGGAFSAGGVTQTAGAAGATNLSYASGYTTYQASVGATGAVSSVGAVIDPIAKAAADAAASSQRAAAKQVALDSYNAEQNQYLQAKAASDALWASYYSTQLSILQQGGGSDAMAYLNSNFYNPAVASSSITEQELAQAQAAYSAYQALPSFAVGVNEIPSDMIARVHQGEEIKPKPFVDKDKDSREKTNEILAEMKAEIVRLTNIVMAGDVAIERNTGKVAKMVDRWEGIGMPEVREAA